MSGIKGKVVIVTGASSGIGEATALLLSARGAKLVLGARRSDRLQALASRIASAGGEAVYAPTDVTRRADLSNLVKLACERYGKLDVVAVGACRLLDETEDGREEACRDIRHDDAHEVRLLPHEAPGHEVGGVAKLRDGVLDALADLRAHVALAVHHPGDGCYGDSCLAGKIHYLRVRPCHVS